MMVDEIAKLGLMIGGFLASKDMLNKLLGPTAEYLGEGMRHLVARSRQNVGTILSAAWKKLGDKLGEPGQVNPRILKHIIDEGRFIEDEFAAEYFGGLLASARTKGGQDDSLLPLLDLVKSMPVIQLRLHFIIYDLVARLPYGRETADRPDLWNGLILTLDAVELVEALSLETGSRELRAHEAVLGLIDAKLIEGQYALRLGEVQAAWVQDMPVGKELVVRPNPKGADLFLKALGLRQMRPDVITSVVVEDRLLEPVKAAMMAPVPARHTYEVITDPVETALDEMEHKVDELVDELKDEIETLRDQTDEAGVQPRPSDDDGGSA